MGTGAVQRGRRGIAARLAWAFLACLIASRAVADCAPDRIDFKTSAGDAAFSAEVVDDEASRAKGLMWREEMAADHGMLFVYPSARQVSFWMRNTPLPLDIIFLNRRGVVCSVAAHTTPFSEAHIPSGCAAQTVFEVNAGEAARRGIAPGVVARHPAILSPLWRCE